MEIRILRAHASQLSIGRSVVAIQSLKLGRNALELLSHAS